MHLAQGYQYAQVPRIFYYRCWLRHLENSTNGEAHGRKDMKWALHQWEYFGSEVRYITGLYAGQTDLVCLHNDLETVVDFKQANRPKKKNGSKIIIFKSQRTPWHTTMSRLQIRQGVIMVCTPDLYYQEFRITDHELRTWKHKFLKRLDMYHELIYDEKEKANVSITEKNYQK